MGSVLMQITTPYDSVQSNKTCAMLDVQSCNHSEAHSNIFLCMANASRKGHGQGIMRGMYRCCCCFSYCFLQSTWFLKPLDGVWYRQE